MAGPLDIVIRFTGDASDAVAAANKTSDAYGGLAQKMSKVGLAMSAAITLPMALAGKAAVSELMDSQKVAAQTAAVIKSTGGAAGVSAKQVDELAQSLMHKSGIDDEAIASSENLLLTFRAVHNEAGKGNDIFNQATEAALDLSIAFGKDLQGSTILVGKALQDPIKGMAALSRVGVQFTADQKATIAAMVATGDVMGAQKMILKELHEEVGGSAAAYGQTLAGNVSRAKEELLNAGASMVGVVAPGLRVIAEAASAVAGFMAQLPAPVKAAVTVFALLVAAMGPALTIIGNFGKIIEFLGPAFKIAKTAIEGFIVTLGEMTAAEAVATAGITLAVAAITSFIAWSVLSKSSAENAADAGKKWGESQAELARNAGDAAAQLEFLHGKHKLVTAQLKDAETMLQRYGEASTSVSVAQREFGISTSEAQQRQRELAVTVSELQGKQEGLETAHKQVAAAQREAAAAALVQEQANATLAASAKGVAGATNEQRDAVNGLANAYFAAQGGAIGYQAAQLQVESAQAKLDALIAGGSIPTSLEYRQAVNAVDQAHLQAGQAAYTMETNQAALSSTLSGPARASLVTLRDSLVAAEAKHHDATGATQEHIAKLDALIATGEKIKPEKEMKIKVESQQAHADLDAVDKKANDATRPRSIKVQAEIIDKAFESQFKQLGGIVQGPRGTPQLIVAHAGERVVPNYKTGLASTGGSSSSGGSPTFNITVQVPVGGNPATIGATVVDSIRAYERVSGTAWRSR